MSLTPDDIQELARRIRQIKGICNVEILEDRYVIYEDQGQGRIVSKEWTFEQIRQVMSAVIVTPVNPKQSKGKTPD